MIDNIQNEISKESVMLQEGIASMLSLSIANVKNKIINGMISNKCFTEESIRPIKLFSPVNVLKSKITIKKIKLGIPPLKEKAKTTMIGTSPPQLKNPNSIITQKMKNQLALTKPEQFNYNILRQTKTNFRSISKEIDKRTKKEFKMIKKNFQFMQFKNPFLPCYKMNVNNNDKKKAADSINLPILNYNSLNKKNNRTLIGLLKLTKENHISIATSMKGNSSRRHFDENISESPNSQCALKRNSSAMLLEGMKI